MLPELKILIIDDDEDDYFITSRYLAEIETFYITCDWSYNINDAKQKLISNDFDIYFLDYRLGAKTGLDLLTEAIENGAYKPIVVLTGKGTLEIDRLAVKSGAYDYLIKSELNSEKLERCIRYALERFRSFKVINDNERKYRLIFENALSFIFTCDQNMRFSDCNEAAQYFLGYSAKELKGMSFVSLLSDGETKNFGKLLSEKKSIKNLRLKFQSIHGEIKIGNVSLSYFEPEDMGAYWQGIIFDETTRVQAEQEKIQTEKLEATYRLVRTLAHEIRNPLTNIGLSIEGLQEMDIKDHHVQYIDIIKRGSKRIGDIISELLNSSKTIDLKLELVDLNSVIKEVAIAAQDRIELKNIRTSISLPEFPVIKLIDKDKFKIAVLNLLVNAIEAMNDEQGLLTISLNQTRDQTSIVIKDNGMGMNEEHMKKLFEPYFTTKKNGMGLGLVSALNIIKSHQAIIDVKSIENEGTCFRIVFPERAP